MARARDLALPIYLVLGTGIRSRRRARAPRGRRSDDKTLDVREGLLHEVLNEPEGPAIVSAMADWMKARLGP